MINNSSLAIRRNVPTSSFGPVFYIWLGKLLGFLIGLLLGGGIDVGMVFLLKHVSEINSETIISLLFHCAAIPFTTIVPCWYLGGYAGKKIYEKKHATEETTDAHIDNTLQANHSEIRISHSSTAMMLTNKIEIAEDNNDSMDNEKIEIEIELPERHAFSLSPIPSPILELRESYEDTVIKFSNNI